MEDAYYYKIRSMENELKWIDAEIKSTGFFNMIPSEDKRRSIRRMLADVRRHVESIQQKLGTEFVQEFPDE